MNQYDANTSELISRHNVKVDELNRAIAQASAAITEMKQRLSGGAENMSSHLSDESNKWDFEDDACRVAAIEAEMKTTGKAFVNTFATMYRWGAVCLIVYLMTRSPVLDALVFSLKGGVQ